MRQSQYEYIYSAIDTHIASNKLTAQQIISSEYLMADLNLSITLSFDKEFGHTGEFFEIPTIVNNYLTALL